MTVENIFCYAERDNIMSWDKDQLRTLFDQDAQRYSQSRPGYPEALFDDIIAFSGIAPDGRILEIGSGAGQAALPFARRGYTMLCVEPGANLAAVLRSNVRGYPQVKVHVGTFEEWHVEPCAFDLVVSATAFHWLDSSLAYPKVRAALKSTGTIALFWQKHVRIEADQGFFEAVQDVYWREASELAKEGYTLPWSHEVDESVRVEMDETGLFGNVMVRRYSWEQTYTAESYIHLLETYSDHIALDEQTRSRLFQGIGDLIDTKFQGHITKGYMAILYLAHCK